MSSGDQPNLNSCGCCAGLPPLSPEQNDPGLPTISYRLGTYSTFLRRMLSQIQSPDSLTAPPAIPWVLSALTTRSNDDPAIALMDGLAVVADVLTFYQERIANEGYLRTATERQSVLQLAREIGFELSPGVAAGVYVAFTAEDVIGSSVAAPLPQTPKVPNVPTQGAPTFNFGTVTVPQGSQMQSIPAQGKLPQTFETSADTGVRTQWNIILPRLTRPADLALGNDGNLYLLGIRAEFPPGTKVTSLTPANAYVLNPDTPPLSASVDALGVQQIFLTGIATKIQTGDRLLLVGHNSAGQTLAVPFIVRNVVTFPSQNQTRVDFADNPSSIPFTPAQFAAASIPSQAIVFNQSNVNAYVLETSIEEGDLQSLIRISGWDPDRLAALVNNLPALPFSEEGVYAFRTEASFFGHNAQLWMTLTNPLNNTLRGDAFPQNWDAANNGAGRFIWTDSQGNFYRDATVFLERTFPQLLKDSWALFESPTVPATPYRITQLVERSLADYGLTGKAAGLVLQTPQGSPVLGLSSPSVVGGGPSRLDIFAIGSNCNLYHQWGNSGAWQQEPEALFGSKLVNFPSAVAGGPSPLEVFAIGSDGNLYHDWWNGAFWSGWWSLGGGHILNSPSVVASAADVLDVFAIGSDGNLYHWWFNTFWSGPQNLGGASPGGPNLVNSPAAIARGPSPVEIFAISSDGNLFHSWWDGANWNGPATFTPNGPNLQASPAVVSGGPNPLDVFAIDKLGNLYHWWFNGAWNGPENRGGRNLVNSPSATRNGPNPLDIFAVGTDGNLYHTWWNKSWSGFENLGGGNLTGSPSALADSPNPLDILVTGSDGNLYHNWFDGTFWQGFENLGGGDLAPFLVRKSTAYVQSDQQALAEFPVIDDIPAGSLTLMLNGMVIGLTPGQAVALNGTRSDAPGVVANEILILQDIVHNGGFTTLEFSNGLQYSYQRQTVTLTANVARATQGATVAVPEVLGSGDASQVNQSFTLKRSPLTYISAPTPSGAASTLQVRVNDLLWQESPSLYGLGPSDQSYIIRQNDDGTTTVIFGDGVTGARLPTGQNNVAATYRTGIGPDGNVSAGSLSILQTRPAGVRGVTNPLPASGGAPPEDLDHARSDAPLTVLTLDRIVSLEDYEDFASAFAGIGKAQAIPLWDGETGLVHLTVAGVAGAPVDRTSQLYLSLVSAINAARDPVQQVLVASYQPVLFHLSAAVIIDEPRYVAAQVLAAAQSALSSFFSFDQRAFAQPVTAAEVIATIQAVPGVIATDLAKLYRDDDPSGPSQLEPQAVLAASFAHGQNGNIIPAELLLLNPIGFTLAEKKS